MKTFPDDDLWFGSNEEKKNLFTLLSFNTMGMAPYSKTTLLI